MRKFILTSNGELRFGDVAMHKDLLEDGDICIGGGLYEFDYVSNRLLLSDKSYDYGTPTWQMLDRITVPEAFRGLTILWEGMEIADWIKIEYKTPKDTNTLNNGKPRIS